MRISLITISVMVGLGVVVSLPNPANGWPTGWGSVPEVRRLESTGSAWSPWGHRGYGHPGMYPRPYGPPRYGPVPYAWGGYGPRGSARPGFPGRSRPGHLKPRQGPPDIWAPDTGGDIYLGFTSPPAPAADGEAGGRPGTVSKAGAAPLGGAPVGQAPTSGTPVPETGEATAGESSATEVTEGAAAEARASQSEPRREAEISAAPPVAEEGMSGPVGPVPSDSVAPAAEPEVFTADGPPSTVEAAGQEAAATVGIEPAVLTPPPAAQVAGTEPAVEAVADAVAEDTPAPVEAVLETAAGRPSETPAVAEQAPQQSTESAAGEAAETAEEQRRSPVQRWLSPKPGFR